MGKVLVLLWLLVMPAVTWSQGEPKGNPDRPSRDTKNPPSPPPMPQRRRSREPLIDSLRSMWINGWKVMRC
jgi:hypothetical protein